MGLCDWMWLSFNNFTNMTDTDYAGVSPASGAELFKVRPDVDDFKQRSIRGQRCCLRPCHLGFAGARFLRPSS